MKSIFLTYQEIIERNNNPLPIISTITYYINDFLLYHRFPSCSFLSKKSKKTLK
jgi:hypothetical protein